MFEKNPIILAIGCSFTDPNFLSHVKDLTDEQLGGWTVWPEHFKNKLEAETGKKYTLINVACSGHSLSFMARSLMENLAKYGNRIEIVLCGGTQFQRYQDYLNQRPINPQMPSQPNIIKDLDFSVQNVTDCNWRKSIQDLGITAATIGDVGTKYLRKEMIVRALSYIWNMQQLCRFNNIKFLYYQLTDTIASFNDMYEMTKAWSNDPEWDTYNFYLSHPAKDSEFALTSPYAKDISKNKKNYIGLPIMFPEHMDWSTHMLKERDPYTNKRLSVTHVVKSQFINDDRGVYPSTITGVVSSEIDVHPNAIGQKHISKQVWSHYANNFL